MIENSDSPAAKLLLQSINAWFSRVHHSSYMHDPLTLSRVISDDMLRFTNGSVVMNKNGQMKISERGKLIEFSRAANYDLFMSMLYARLPFREKIRNRS